jgi:hypothetical protein
MEPPFCGPAVPQVVGRRDGIARGRVGRLPPPLHRAPRDAARLIDCHFRALPVAATLDEELAREPWFYVGDRDIFPEEFLPFLGLTPAQRDVFLAARGDLLEPDFWQAMQREQHAGRVVDIFPYTSRRRRRAASSDSEDAPTPAAVSADRAAVVRTAD